MSFKSKVSFTRRNLTAAAAALATITMTGKANAQRSIGSGDRPDGKPFPGGRPGRNDVQCMLRGTLIDTPNGERAVEALNVGDMVLTKDGAAKPILWIGKRAVHRSGDGSWAQQVLPVKITSSAIADQVPARDVYLSQAHAIEVDGALVSVGDLVNGLTITLESPDHFEVLEYFHIELAVHEVVFASGLPIETLNCQDQAAQFDNARLSRPATQMPLTVLGLAGRRHVIKSRLRSALAPWVDRRQTFDIIRDKIEERGISRAA